MDHETAQKLVEIIEKFNGNLNELTELTMAMPDVEEAISLLRKFSDIRVIIFDQIMRPTIREHLDLDPDIE